MEARFVIAWLFALSGAISPAVAIGKYHSDSRISDPLTIVKQTNLHFFLHVTRSGDNPSTVLVAKSNSSVVGEGNPWPFGTMFVLDDPLTEGPDPKSKVIGNSQGILASTNRGKDTTLLIDGDFAFTYGEFNGSSFIGNSRYSILELGQEQELAVVGGRGKLRMARGFALSKTYFRNSTTGDAIVEYDVTIFHQ